MSLKRPTTEDEEALDLLLAKDNLSEWEAQFIESIGQRDRKSVV